MGGWSERMETDSIICGRRSASSCPNTRRRLSAARYSSEEMSTGGSAPANSAAKGDTVLEVEPMRLRMRVLD